MSINHDCCSIECIFSKHVGHNRYKYDTRNDIMIFASEILCESIMNNLDIKYSFVEASTKKENKRYQLAAFPPSIIVYRGDKKIGDIFPFTERDEMKSFLIKGNKLHFPSFVLRDMETGLLTGPEELDYIVK